MDLKQVFIKYRKFIEPCLVILNRLKLKKKVRGTNNIVEGLGHILLKSCQINICGNNNRIVFNEMTTVVDVNIVIDGNDNTIFVGKRNYLQGCCLCCEDNKNQIILGNHTYIHNQSELAATEGTTILLGNDCLLSSDIKIRTGDSHVIYKVDDGKRINYAQDVHIGNHVWIGNKVSVLKGTVISDNCIIGTGSIVTSKLVARGNSLIVGSPGRVVKEGVSWSAERRSYE